ncbi:MAG: NAD(P)/FAD-dependent oxidoreductase [FCB group bacterium]|nr:NAD(P)/FAD-dependent oxidoreductase [FCB group bacterium]
MIPQQTDIVVVGGGPAGSTFALHAAQSGLDVIILEKDRDIGVPVRCGEAVSDAGLRIFHEPDSRWIRSTIDRMRMIAPDETIIEFPLKEIGYILDRRIFDLDLARFAAEAGARVFTKTYVHGLLFRDDFVTGVRGLYLNEPFEVQAKLVIGADGVESRVGRWAGIRTQLKLKDIESGLQKTVSGIDVSSNIFDFYLSTHWAPGGYLWVFPKGKHMANIGLAINGTEAKKGRSARSFLEAFIADKYPQGSVLSTVAGGVPVARTVVPMVTDGLMLVGDAAHTVNPLTGGGIISGMRSGLLAAETASKILIANENPTRDRLNSYSKAWASVGGKNHERLYRLKESIYRFKDDELNAIAHRLSAVPESDLSLFKIFSTALRAKPSLLIDVARLFTGI